MIKLRTEWDNKSLEFIQIRYTDVLELTFRSKSKNPILTFTDATSLPECHPLLSDCLLDVLKLMGCVIICCELGEICLISYQTGKT